MTMTKTPFIIAEIGCNHMGNMEIAKEMIYTAAIFCKVDAVKTQKRCNKELLPPEQYNAPHPVSSNSYGNTYGEHREFLEFSLEQHIELMEFCQNLNITYSTSVWDLTSAKEISALNPKFIKIPSASNNNLKMLEYLAQNYFGEIHISLGMTTREEEKQIISLFEGFNRNKDIIIYSCTSGYPVSFEDICLLEIRRLKESYGHCVKDIGFSGHHLGIAADIAALTLGANYFERHFTLNRTWKGSDHAASLEPDGIRKLARDLKNVSKSLKYKEQIILDIEKPQRAKLKYKAESFNLSLMENTLRSQCKILDKVDFNKTQSEPVFDIAKAPKDIRILVMDVDGVLTDAGMYYDQFGNELKKFNTRDGKGIELLRNKGIKTAIITAEKTQIVENRAKKLKIDFLYQGITDKKTQLMNLSEEVGIPLENIAYIGDDINDLEAMKIVGLSACPADSEEEIKKIASAALSKKGGQGAVREFCKIILEK